MVNIVDGKVEKEKARERLEKLVNLAKKLFGENSVIKPIPPSHDFAVSGILNIYPWRNQIEVLPDNDLEQYKKILCRATNLVGSYEILDKNEWDLIKL